MAKTRNIYGLGSKGGAEKLPKGKTYFLAIAINDYQHFTKLKNAVKDVKDISEILINQYGFEERAPYTSLFLNEQATRKKIIRKLKDLCNRVKPEDKVLIYYSGHGYLDPVTKRGYWIPVEAEKEDDAAYVANSDVRDYIKAMNSRHTLLISDSCFSESLLVRDAQRDIASAYEDWETRRSRWIFCSGKGIVSDGRAGSNSPFAKQIIEKLSNPKEEKINISRLAEEVIRSISFNYEQKPEASPFFGANHDGGQFIFYRRIALEDQEEAIWQSAIKRNSIIAYDDYLEEYPQGKYANVAEQKMNVLEAAENAWQITQQKDSLTGYRSFARRYPKSEYHQEALNRIKALKEAARQREAAAEEIKRSTKKAPAKPKVIQPEPKIITAPNTFTDPRDGQVYKTVKLKDGKIWMAQNLNFDVGEGCWYYDNDPKNGEKYGRLYTWEAAQKACPPGWHVPSDEEWWEMASYYGKAISFIKTRTGSDGKAAFKALIRGGSSGFNALLGGQRNSDGDFKYLEKCGDYWSSTENGFSAAWYYGLASNLYRIYILKRLGFSCRCLQD